MNVLIALGLLLAFGVICLGFWYLPAYLLHRGKKVVTCPEDSLRAAVEVNVARYAATSVLDRPTIELKSCTRWPEKAACGRACASQIGGEEPQPA